MKLILRRNTVSYRKWKCFKWSAFGFQGIFDGAGSLNPRLLSIQNLYMHKLASVHSDL